MIIRGIEIAPVCGASGVQGFFGEGYWFHWLFWFIGLFFGRYDSGLITFVAKTTTLNKRPGNMSLLSDGITPRDWFPDCVVVKPMQGVALNAVGLSGPGAQALFDDGRWQKRKKPFFISFMSTELTVEARFAELQAFVEMFKQRLGEFHPGTVHLQWNVTCPNVGVHSENLVKEVHAGLDILAGLGILIFVKLAVTVAVSSGCEIAEHNACDGIVISNTIPWKQIDKALKLRLFGSETSPLEKYKGGGLSGAPLLPLVCQWVKEARSKGMTKHINAGGGILHPQHVTMLFEAGADTAFLGSIAFERSWHMRGCIRRAYYEHKKRNKLKGVTT